MKTTAAPRASSFLVHFFDIDCTTMKWNLLMNDYDVLQRQWTNDDKFSFFFVNLDKVFKNSSPREIAYIWKIKQLQIDAITFEM